MQVKGFVTTQSSKFFSVSPMNQLRCFNIFSTFVLFNLLVKLVTYYLLEGSVSQSRNAVFVNCAKDAAVHATQTCPTFSLTGLRVLAGLL